MRLRRFLFAVSLFLGVTSSAHADVILTFYSHRLGTYRSDIAFLHAFIGLAGTTGADKKPVHANFGFTASEVPASILWKPVRGEVASMQNDYIAASQRHFSIPITDAQYRAVLSIVARWRNYPQPSYDLDTHNCVTFVKEIALALRLPASSDSKFVHSPQDFLEDLRRRTGERAIASQRSRRPAPGSRLSAAAKTTKRADMALTRHTP